MEADTAISVDQTGKSGPVCAPIWFTVGRYLVKEARNAAEIAKAQALRARHFDIPGTLDIDDQDQWARHFLIYDGKQDVPSCCFRLRSLAGSAVNDCYAARSYDLTPLMQYDAPMLEIGRFCVAPGGQAPDLIRLAWAAITKVADATGAGLLFGCSSFEGVDPRPHIQAFSHLNAAHRAPGGLAVQVRSAEVVVFDALADAHYCQRTALRQMPPLLRSYLGLGAWVSDHAVVDRQMNTLHVFTGLETSAIPAARKRLLRALV